MNELVLNQLIGLIAAVFLTCLMFWMGAWYEKKVIAIKQRDCSHEFRMIRICKKCDLKQREVR